MQSPEHVIIVHVSLVTIWGNDDVESCEITLQIPGPPQVTRATY